MFVDGRLLEDDRIKGATEYLAPPSIQGIRRESNNFDVCQLMRTLRSQG